MARERHVFPTDAAIAATQRKRWAEWRAAKANAEAGLKAGEKATGLARGAKGWAGMSPLQRSREMRRRMALRSGKTNGKTNKKGKHEQAQEVDSRIAYAFGRIEAWIEGYAGRTGLPVSALANGISRLLHDTTGR